MFQIWDQYSTDVFFFFKVLFREYDDKKIKKIKKTYSHHCVTYIQSEVNTGLLEADFTGQVCVFICICTNGYTANIWYSPCGC